MFEILEPHALRQLESLQLRSQRKFLGSRQGGNVSLRRGHGIEFADYRRYELGDDPRHIDWGVYGRTDRLYVKQFQEEQDITVYCLLDGSASMHHPAEDRKFQKAAELALGVLYIALAHHDQVSLVIPGETVFGPRAGVALIHELAELCEGVGPIAAEKSEEGFSHFLHTVQYPGVCLFISDFLFPLPHVQHTFESLYSNNLDVIAIQVVGAHDENPGLSREEAIFVDSETGAELPLRWSPSVAEEYRYRFEVHQAAVRELAAKYQIRFFSCGSAQGVLPFFSETLAGSGVLRT
ncbi:DUF58 domain-containing protein [bacterium]|nr:DUF58 domain-containing protein [bacterium]